MLQVGPTNASAAWHICNCTTACRSHNRSLHAMLFQYVHYPESSSLTVGEAIKVKHCSH
jgi:hypothetical protein